MPIRAEFRHLYRRQWLTVTRPRILERAGQRCERCRKPLHAWIFTYTWKTRDPQFSGVWRYHMTVFAGIAEFERDFDPGANSGRAYGGEEQGGAFRAAAEAESAAGGAG